jgi:hypothetical protein
MLNDGDRGIVSLPPLDDPTGEPIDMVDYAARFGYEALERELEKAGLVLVDDDISRMMRSAGVDFVDAVELCAKRRGLRPN